MLGNKFTDFTTKNYWVDADTKIQYNQLVNIDLSDIYQIAEYVYDNIKPTEGVKNQLVILSSDYGDTYVIDYDFEEIVKMVREAREKAAKNFIISSN